MARRFSVHDKMKPKEGLATLWRLFKYFKYCRTVFVFAVLSVVVYCIAIVLAAYLMRPLVNFLEVSGITPDEAYAEYLAVLTGMAVLYFLAVVTNYLLNRLMLQCSAKILESLRIDMFNSMQNLPISHFDSRTHGEMMSFYTNDTDAIRELLHHSITQMMISILALVGIIVMMLVLSLKLFLIMIVLGITVTVIVKLIGDRSSKCYRQQQETVSKVNGFIEEMVVGQRDIKVFTHEEEILEGFDPLNETLRKSATDANYLGNIVAPLLINLSHMFYAITTAVGVLWLTGAFVGGVLIAFLQYVRQFAERVSQISQEFTFILLALAGAERVFKLIDEVPEDDSGSTELTNVENGKWVWKTTCENGEVTATPLRGEVRFIDVDFSYDGQVPVLRNVSLYAKPGQKIAFVGSTGAGKTTITNLINRFYETEKGLITFDGIDIKSIKKSSLRHALGMVLQDTHLFTGTVMENIRYGRLDASDEDCINAAKTANAHYFISHLPQGYDTVLYSDGANLSQGQRQLLAIARTAVSDPPVLILDEATSSIDTRTEKLIEEGMDALMEGRTVFVIAHRLSTVRNSNAILVLEHGEIIERGDHADLLKQEGKYYQLYTGMFELT